MELENIGAIEQVSTEPADLGVEAQEVTEPVTEGETVVEAEQEAAPPARDKERDSWFAEQRRKLDAERKEIETKFQSQIEAERNRIAELETKTKTYEVNDRNVKLRALAEQNGWDAEVLIAQADEEAKIEAEKAEIITKLQTKETEAEQLAKEKQDLLDEIYSLKMTMEDKDELLKFDPNINLTELGKDFYQLRSVLGKTPLEAYKMVQANKPETVIAESPGKLNSTQTESEFYTEAEWDSMSDEQQNKLLENPATQQKVFRSHAKWINK